MGGASHGCCRDVAVTCRQAHLLFDMQRRGKARDKGHHTEEPEAVREVCQSQLEGQLPDVPKRKDTDVS